MFPPILLLFPILKIYILLRLAIDNESYMGTYSDSAIDNAEEPEPDTPYTLEGSATHMVNSLQIEEYYRSHVKTQNLLNKWSFGCMLALCFDAMMISMIYLIARNS